MDNIEQIKRQTKCRIPGCTATFVHYAMDVPIVGQRTPDTIQKFVGELAKHLMKKHPEKWEAINIGGTEFMGLLILMLYETTDQNLVKAQDQVKVSLAGLLGFELKKPETPALEVVS